MNKYAINFFAKEDVETIQNFRKKFDPKADLIAPHITLAFPFPAEVNLENLLTEVETKLSKYSHFTIKLENVYLNPEDNYLYLLITEGSDQISLLHDDLYSGLLHPYLRKDLTFTPHMTIGVFNTSEGKLDENKYKEGLEELKTHLIQTTLSFNNINIVEIEDFNSPRIITKSFELK